MNMRSKLIAKKINHILSAISHPARLRILLAIGPGEACVCHLEAILGYRQPYISQHLMALREVDLLKTRRDGRFIFYRLTDSSLIDLIKQAGVLTNIPKEEIDALVQLAPRTQCCCPNCTTTSIT